VRFRGADRGRRRGLVTVRRVRAASRSREIACFGINACKGQSACTTAVNACTGQNACKGQGFLNVPAKEWRREVESPLADPAADPAKG